MMVMVLGATSVNRRPTTFMPREAFCYQSLSSFGHRCAAETQQKRLIGMVPFGNLPERKPINEIS